MDFCKIKPPKKRFITLNFTVVLFCTIFPSSSLGDLCRTSCNNIPILYPFGVDEGCGASPDYRLSCLSDKALQLNLSSSAYDILRIQYDHGTIVLQDFNDQSSSCGNLRGPYPIYSLSDNFIACGDINSGNFTQLLPALCSSWLNPSCARDTFYTCHTTDNCCAVVVPDTSFSNCGVYGPATSSSGVPSLSPGLSPLSSNLIELEIELGYQSPHNQTSCLACKKTNGVCGYSSDSSFVCMCGGTNSSFQCTDAESANCADGNSCHKRHNNTPAIIGASIGCTIGLLGVVALCLLFSKRGRTQNKKLDLYDLKPGGKDTDLMQKLNSPETTLFSYKELETATDSFSKDLLLGDGGFSTVYKGTLSNGCIVAVKKLNQWNKQGLNQFYNEVMILSKVSHPNLVKLLGCCLEGRELLVVYEFVSNGTFADHLHGNRGKGLNWETRLKISVETARALQYLHDSVRPPIFHRDVKPTNILLDENFHTKVGDFGLSRFVPLEATHVSTAPQGTPGYLDPEYYESYQLTDKSDVYSLGVVLMEMISAKKAVDMSRDKKEINLASLAISKVQCGALQELVDPNLNVESNPQVKQMVTSVAELAFCCLAPEKDDRPCMKEVADKLEQILKPSCRGAFPASPKENSASFGDFSETRLLIKSLTADSPVSVVESGWLTTSTDSSKNSQ